MHLGSFEIQDMFLYWGWYVQSLMSWAYRFLSDQADDLVGLDKIRPRLHDAAYIAAWMIDCCNLIGRKVVFEPPGLVLRLYYTLFSMNQNYDPQWSSPIFYPTTKVQNSVMFSPIMSTKCNRFSWILFADQKRKNQSKPFSIFPLCLTWLYCPCI